MKRRDPPLPGSIPAAPDMFRAEVRFYRCVAPVAGIRVPACYRAEVTPAGTLLELEDRPLLSFSDTPTDSDEAVDWISRLEEAIRWST